MLFFSPLRPLLKGWALSFFGWGLVALAMAAHGVVTRGDAWSMHLAPGLRDWLPWAVWTPLIFRLVARLPLDRARWRLAVPVHLAACAIVIGVGHWWKGALGFEGRTGPGGPPPWGRGTGLGPPEWRERLPHPRAGSGEAGPGRDLLPSELGAPPPDGFHSDRPFPRPDGDFREGPGFGNREPQPGRGPAPGFPAPLSGRGEPGPRRGFDPLRFFSFQLPIYLMLLTGAHAAVFFRRDQERAASLARARLDALRAQLQPHFLFNTLNTIAGLVHDEPDRADAMLTRLSELLRMTLDASQAHELPLSHELDFLERYLQLMHARFEERLRFSIDAPPEVRAALVPPMLLQPLVENAIEHGLGPKLSGGLVLVRAWREGDTLRLAVIDDGVGFPAGAPPPEGIGVSATRARLRELYGTLGTLGLRRNDDGSGACAEIAMPFRTEKTAANSPA